MRREWRPVKDRSGFAPDARFRRWRTLTVALMVTGYAGYYLCRSNLAVAMPLLVAELGTKGIAADAARVHLGNIASLGVFTYAIGKFPCGWLADFLGGRRNFLFGMLGTVLFTLLFAVSGGLPLFTMAWIGNRLVQSFGWSGMVKITSRWFSYSGYGTAMGVVSLSYLFGDAAARQFMSMLLAAGFGWRGVFFAAAATLGAILVVNVALLKETPERLGYAEPPANPANLFREEGEKHTPESLGSLLGTFARSGTFWVVCVVAGCITIVRETFNLWTPTYFTQAAGLSVSDAARMSSLFPFFGGISVLLAGFLGDRLGRNGRAWIMIWGMLLTAAALGFLAFGDLGGSKTMPVALVTLVAFLMTGPYSYLAGAISLDFGGKQGSATASGLIDGAGYLGGVLAGGSVARILALWGWRGAFASLAGAALASSVAAAVYARKGPAAT